MSEVRSIPVRDDGGPFQLVIVVLSVYVLFMLLVETLVHLPPDVAALLASVDNFICIIFLGDFAYRFARAKSKTQFMRWGWIDLISSIPMIDALRWGRAVRVIRIVRTLRALRSARVLATYFFRRRAESAFATVTLVGVTLVIASSVAILNFEVDPKSNITTPNDALWWSLTTITTVGYGDRYPVTTEGRAIAVLLMIAGIAIFGTFTGFVASYFVAPEKRSSEMEALTMEIRALRERIESLEKK